MPSDQYRDNIYRTMLRDVNCAIKCLCIWRSPVPLHAVEELNGRKLGYGMCVIVSMLPSVHWSFFKNPVDESSGSGAGYVFPFFP